MLLPDKIIEEFRQLLDDGESYQWLHGRYIQQVIEHYPEIPRHKVIEELANRTSRDKSTLRDRHIMAEFYSPDVVEEFYMLTYHQLRACKAAGEKWREYAEWAANNLPAPVAVIRARIRNEGHDQPGWVNRWKTLQQVAYNLANDGEAPDIIRLAARSVLLINAVVNPKNRNGNQSPDYTVDEKGYNEIGNILITLKGAVNGGEQGKQETDKRGVS